MDITGDEGVQDSQETNQQYELVGYDLQTGKKIQRTALGGGLLFTYKDGQYQSHSVFLQDGNESPAVQ